MIEYLLKQKIGMVKKILIRGADIDYRNKLGKTALHYAIEESLPESYIRFLLGRGANPHLEDAMGWDCCSKGKIKYPAVKDFKNCTPELRQKFEKKTKGDAESDDHIPLKEATSSLRQDSEEDKETEKHLASFKYGPDESFDSKKIKKNKHLSQE